MRHGASGRRSRNRSGGGRGRGGNNRSQVFDSNGPDVRIRGTAHQIYEKYVALAKDANGCCDYILAESYLQHAEHYQRVINSFYESAGGNRNNAEDGAAQENEKARDNRGGRGNRKKPERREDDLGLPASITGAGAKKEDLEDA